jgi:AraC-like DNA-binding protein
VSAGSPTIEPVSASPTVAVPAIRAPDQRIRGLLHRDYLGFTQAASTNERWLATPTPSATVILNVGDPFGGLPAAFAAGLTDSYEIIEQNGPIVCVDLKFSPLGAYTLLGVPMSELTGRVVDLGDVLGVATGRRIVSRLADAPAWAERFDLLDGFLLALADRGPRPAPEVSWAWRRLTATNGTMPIGALAQEVGWSRRHLIARFRQQVGLPPKTMARVVRFEHLLRRLRAAPPRRWGQVAAECGYYDQAHMNRDFREFAGTTPTDYLARLTPR